MDYETLCLDYELDFDARAYRDVIVSDFKRVYQFFIRQLRQVFATEAKGKTILDVGCGPSVYTALLASSTFDDIVLSEFLRGNREQLERWIKNDSSALDWSPIVEYVARVEGYNDVQAGAEKILRRTRSAVRKVIPCDVTSPGILPECHRSTFDAVVSSLCLEAAVLDDIAYCAAIADIGRLVRPGGSLILCGLTGNVAYTVGKKRFSCFPYAEDLVRARKKVQEGVEGLHLLRGIWPWAKDHPDAERSLVNLPQSRCQYCTFVSIFNTVQKKVL